MSKTAKRLHGKSNTACVFQGRNKNIQASSCLSFIMLLFKQHILCLACKRNIVNRPYQMDVWWTFY